MIPSVLAGQLKQGIEDFLKITFPITTPFFHQMLDQFINTRDNLFKGPFLSLNLPFQTGKDKKDFFPELPLSYRPYRHQEKAFTRLSGNKPKSTLIATGTGSGKTECFMYPILDHVFHQRGQRGIKAILIYPMNALATDQAGRLAKLIYNNPNLRGFITAGLYVGRESQQPQPVMTKNNIITDKDIIRKNPPDILLTNYKMLDYLLIRPDDRILWEDNLPETLKYLVVDELHTFDGAQGTDLACLIRRLKSRLSVPGNHLCCVGTSATIGSENQQEELQKYAEKVFAEPFDNDSIITEERLTVGQFLEKSYIRYIHTISPGQHQELKPTYDTEALYIESQYQLWFGEPSPLDINHPQWRTQLAEQLKSHQVFQNLLRVLQGRVLSIPDIIEELKRVSGFPVNADVNFYEDLFNSLIALVSFARVKSGETDMPFLDVRVQFWMRELRRMTAEVKTNPQLRFHDDLKEEQLVKHLPVIHCRDCGSTGWGGVFNRGNNTIQNDLKNFYIHFFKHKPNLTFLFPQDGNSTKPAVKGMVQYLCPQCLHLSANKEKCTSCGSDESIRVLVPDVQVKKKEENVSSNDCPFCGSLTGLTIMGSRAASLISAFISQLGASTYNQDRKIVTFSDSVQDAAHRAGFFNARTYNTNFRAALAQVVQTAEGKTLDRLPALFSSHWLEQMGENAYITTFIGPNMEWLNDYDYLRLHGNLPEGSDLIDLVDKRVGWNITSEYGFRARIGRTLERSSVSVLYPNQELLQTVVDNTLEILRNETGALRDLLPFKLKQFLSGLLMHLKLAGGIVHPTLSSYIESGGIVFILSRIPFMPPFSRYLPAPRFLTTRGDSRFEPVLSSGTSLKTWCEHWLYKNFKDIVHIMTAAEPIYKIVLEHMTTAGILDQRQDKKKAAWGIHPHALHVTNRVDQYTCNTCRVHVSVGHAESPLWEGMPCIRLTCDGRFIPSQIKDKYYGKLYKTAAIHRVIARDHTGLLERKDREKLEQAFKENRRPWDPNLLSATPTIEMGIDIGDLSNIILCSVPPTTANYLQRIGRSGRKNGNSLNITVANGRPHDLYFFAEPESMITGAVQPPGIYLEASAILERQFIAFCFDRWVQSGIDPTQFPDRIDKMLNHVGSQKSDAFPYTFLRFIDSQRTLLFDTFTSLFKDVLKDETIARLRTFTEGDKEREGSLDYRILDNLTYLYKERESYNTQIRNLRKRIKEKENDPAKSLNYEEEIKEMHREHSALVELVKKINHKQTLNFFTDEGLIPNYSFPEAGVILKSVIYRKKKSYELGNKEEIQYNSDFGQSVYEYERPARSAISELAPLNSFYADGRKVTIQRVDLRLSGVEEWRFCPGCPYSERADIGKPEKKYCPRCGNHMWSDTGQKRKMLRMRQVFANTNDRDSRIHDDKDERDPLFYNKQMLVDIDPANIRDAYKINRDSFPFGFEFLEKAGFTEINFGELGEEGQNIAIAGDLKPRKGFTLCKHCGHVKAERKSKKKWTEGEKKETANHAWDCPSRGKEDENTFLQCIYLYRQFESEAIRILLPAARLSAADKKSYSFVAALQMGLRRKFGGAVDHLQTTIYCEPISDSSRAIEYLVLYDQVPGGTGYLKELMRSPEPLMDVFKIALDILNNCPCNSDPEKDGCYRCLLAYRHGSDMHNTSRDTAVEMLGSILHYKDYLTPTRQLNTIDINPLFDSELEARFIEALRRYKKDGLDITVTKEIVNEKAGYSLSINNNAYYIEPQVILDESAGIAVPSKADFVFRPQRAAKNNKPVAVFADGFRYHKNRIFTDTAQRMALVHSGRFLTWSLTWNDVENQLKKNQTNHYDSLLDPVSKNSNRCIEALRKFNVEKMITAHLQDSFQLLMSYLADPDPETRTRYACARTICNLSPRLFDKDEQRLEYEAGINRINTTEMAEFFHHLDEPKIPGYFPGKDDQGLPFILCLFAAAHSAVTTGDVKQCAFTAYLDDSDENTGDKDFEKTWNSYLRLYNIMQFLPNVFFTTRKGIEGGHYDSLSADLANALLSPVPGKTGDVSWQEIKELTEPLLHPLVEKLAAAGCPVPEPGFEQQDSSGEIIAEAELAWPSYSTVLLTEDQETFIPVFTGGNWQVFTVHQLDRDIDPLVRCLSNPPTTANE